MLRVRKLGAFLSIQGGFDKAIDKAVERGANTAMFFSSPPRDWSKPKWEREAIRIFRKKKEEHSIGPVYFHATYLVNLADAGEIGRRSKELLIEELKLAAEMGIAGSIVHLGSYKDSDPTESLGTLIQNIREVLESTPPETLLIAENAGNRKIGRSLEELGEIIKRLNDSRVRVCLDTCHLHTTGYDLSTTAKLERFLDLAERLIGKGKIECLHINDSKDEFNSFRDRHENIGEGKVGVEVFRNLLNHPRTKDLPFLIETPGFDGKGPDKKNLDILKDLVI